ncbi:MAG: hypothetical protein H0T51_21235 [Pirellulales bacterium]|nr:hypothetical protein [Pirellulales bacterium]
MANRSISSKPIEILWEAGHYIAASPEAADILRLELMPKILTLEHSRPGFRNKWLQQGLATEYPREFWGVSPLQVDQLANELHLRQAVARYLAKQGTATRSLVRFSLYEPGVVFGAGLLERAARALFAHGRRVIVRRDGIPLDPTSDYARFTSDPVRLASPQSQALNVLAKRPRLYYDPDSPDEKFELVLTLAQLFPGGRMLILVNALQAVRGLVDELRAFRDVYIPGRLGTPSPSMVAIDTLSGHDWRSYGGFSLVCVYDGCLLTSRGALQRVRDFASPMPVRIAFGPPETRLTTSEELDIEATFGPLVRRPAAHHAYVVQLQLPPIKGRRYTTGFERKKVHLWGDCVRNEFVAKVAQAVASEGLRGLPHVELPCHDHNRWAVAPRRTCMLVESMDHARLLGSLLPDWELAPDLQRSDRGVTGTGEGNFITTLDRAAGMSLDGFAVILADGALMQWPDYLCSRSTWSSTVVIDFADAFDTRAVGDARSRCDDYGRRGWSVQTMTVTRTQYSPGASVASRTLSN